MTGLERDFLHQLTRIANALEKQNDLQEKTFESLNAQEPAPQQTTEEDDEEKADISELIKKLSKFK
jgi:hypothetical protein